MKILLFLLFCCTLKANAIFNGDTATELKPYQFFLASFATGRFSFGSGVMISRQHVLTTASLVSGFTSWQIGYNSTNLANLIQIECTNAFVHPKFNQSTYFSDVGVILIPFPLFADTIKPIPFPSQLLRLPRINEEGFVVGFGITNRTDLPAPTSSLQISYFIVTEDENCPVQNFDQQKQYNFCARDILRNSQLCEGDVGGAFVINHRGTEVLAGLSTGVSPTCDDTSDGSTFVRIQTILPWLTDVIDLKYITFV